MRAKLISFFPIPFFTFLYDNANKSIANKHNARLFLALVLGVTGLNHSDTAIEPSKENNRSSLKGGLAFPRNYGTINGISGRFFAQPVPPTNSLPKRGVSINEGIGEGKVDNVTQS